MSSPHREEVGERGPQKWYRWHKMIHRGSRKVLGTGKGEKLLEREQALRGYRNPRVKLTNNSEINTLL